jgi:hypothetical protein
MIETPISSHYNGVGWRPLISHFIGLRAVSLYNHSVCDLGTYTAILVVCEGDACLTILMALDQGPYIFTSVAWELCTYLAILLFTIQALSRNSVLDRGPNLAVLMV